MFFDIEIIFVNDGILDCLGEIVEDYVKWDMRIWVIY